MAGKYIYLFLKAVLLKQKEIYSYGYKFSENRMKRQKIMLPVDSSGNIDYRFMDEYFKYLEYKKKDEYLNFLH